MKRGWLTTEVALLDTLPSAEVAAITGKTLNAIYTRTSRKRKNSITCALCIAKDVIYSPACDTCVARMVLTLPADKQDEAIESHGDQAGKLRQAVARIRGQW